jgi:hypothetical protein
VTELACNLREITSFLKRVMSLLQHRLRELFHQDAEISTREGIQAGVSTILVSMFVTVLARAQTKASIHLPAPLSTTHHHGGRPQTQQQRETGAAR